MSLVHDVLLLASCAEQRAAVLSAVGSEALEAQEAAWIPVMDRCQEQTGLPKATVLRGLMEKAIQKRDDTMLAVLQAVGSTWLESP